MARFTVRAKKPVRNPRAETSTATYQISQGRRERVGVFPSMESLAYLHLELACQQPEGEQNANSNNIGDSWNAAGWDEIFDTLDEQEEEEEEVEPT